MVRVEGKGARSSAEFCAWAGIGKTTFWAEVRAGRLKVRYVGSKALVIDEDGWAWLNSLPVKELSQATNREAA